MIYIATILYWTYGYVRRIQNSFEFDLSVKLWEEPKRIILYKDNFVEFGYE